MSEGIQVEKRAFGKTGLQVSVLGFGGAGIGLAQASQGVVDRMLGEALDSGLNVIDTAECYGSEELIGNAVFGRRQQCYLFTKCGHSSGFDLESWDPELIEPTIDRSLRRMRTDYLDLVQLHTCGEDVLRRGDVISALQRARDAGKTRFIGYSGDGEAARYAVESGAFDALQTSVSIADQEAITLTLPLARRHGLGVIAKRPIANAAWKREERPGYAEGEYWDRLKVLDYDFLRDGDDERAVEIALRFTLAAPGVHTAIVGTTNPDHWRQNLSMVRSPGVKYDFQAIRERWQQVADTIWAGQG